jgi:hypothetical protein
MGAATEGQRGGRRRLWRLREVYAYAKCAGVNPVLSGCVLDLPMLGCDVDACFASCSATGQVDVLPDVVMPPC